MATVLVLLLRMLIGGVGITLGVMLYEHTRAAGARPAIRGGRVSPRIAIVGAGTARPTVAGLLAPHAVRSGNSHTVD